MADEKIYEGVPPAVLPKPLTDPWFSARLYRFEGTHQIDVDTVAEAHGVQFNCPCGRCSTIIAIPFPPAPNAWGVRGTGLRDLVLCERVPEEAYSIAHHGLSPRGDNAVCWHGYVGRRVPGMVESCE